MIKNIVVVSDTHFGCKLALCPPKVKFDEGGNYEASDIQLKLWAMWREFWDIFVPKTTRNEDFVIVHNGDIIDGIHHNSTTQISQNITDQIKIAREVLTPLLKRKHCKGYYQIRGTEAHAGKSAQFEEMLAESLDGNLVKDEFNNSSRWELWLRFGDNLLCHFTHHVGTTSSAGYESTAVYKELIEAYSEAGRWKLDAPDCVIRSHRHRFFKIEVPSANTNAIAVVTPAWQLKTPFVYRGALGRSSTPQIGGLIIREGEEVPIYIRQKIWNIERTKTEAI